MSKYHHGDLAATVLSKAAEIIAREGPEALNLRELAKQLGVSHNAFRHHFGNRQGILNALATEGHRKLRAALLATPEAADPHLEAGVSYVHFATENPGLFTIMFRPDLLDLEDPELNEARFATFSVLQGGAQGMSTAAAPAQDAAVGVIASWAIVHGIATLALTGNLAATGLLEAVPGGDIEVITRLVASRLNFGPTQEVS